MIRKLIGFGGVTALAAATLAAAPAQAYPGDHGWNGGGHRWSEGRGYRGGYDGYRGYGGYGGYAGYGGGYGRAGYYDYGHRRHYRCDRGTGGTIVGAIAGGLLGNAVAGRGDRGVGTVLGAGAGALIGRSIDRDC